MAVKNYGVLWVDRFQFIRDVMGYSSVAGGIGSAWNRKYPLAYPDDPHLFAKSVDVTPSGAYLTTTPLSWEKAIVSVTFRAPNWSFSAADDPLFLNSFDQTEDSTVNCTQSLDFGVEWIQIPGSKAVYSDGSKVTTPQSRRTSIARMVLTYPDLPYMPLAKILTYMDVLNDDKFLGRPRGTVMLEGCHTNRKRMTDGTIVQDVSISLKTRIQDWNNVLKPDGTWDTVYYGMSGGLPDTTKTQFQYNNFKPLLFIGSSS